MSDTAKEQKATKRQLMQLVTLAAGEANRVALKLPLSMRPAFWKALAFECEIGEQEAEDAIHHYEGTEP